MEAMTEKDKAILDEAYSTSYASTIRRLIREADTEQCKRILRELLSEATER